MNASELISLTTKLSFFKNPKVKKLVVIWVVKTLGDKKSECNVIAVAE